MAAGRRAKALTDSTETFHAETLNVQVMTEDGFVGERVTIDCEDSSTLKQVGMALAGVTLVMATGGFLAL